VWYLFFHSNLFVKNICWSRFHNRALRGTCSELRRSKQWQNETKKNYIMGKLHNSQLSCLHGSEAFFFFAWLTTVSLYKNELRPVQNPKVHCHRQKFSTLIRVLTHSNPVYMVTTHFFIHVKNEIKKWGFYWSLKIFWEPELKETTSETYIQIVRILKYE
jgi:hypothetical protein